jgi:hypothetical protein
MFIQPNPKNFHIQYLDVNRHWSPRSEKFAGGDNLLTALMRGWEISDKVEKESYWHAGVRQITVYHFRLRRNDQEIAMPVLANPYVNRMLFTSPFSVVERQTQHDEVDSEEQRVS